MFITVAIVQALLAASAFALPSAKERFEKRAALRGDSMGPHRHPRQSLPFQHVQGSYTNKANVDYSSNWAGVVLASEAVSASGDISHPNPNLHCTTGHVELRGRHFQGPHPHRTSIRVRSTCRVRLGRHRWLHLSQRHPPDWARFHR